MNKIGNLLDEVKAIKGIETKYELAKTLGLPTQRISDYYKGERAPDEFACLKIAEALGKPLDTIIATVKAATEKDKTRKEAWENYMKRLGGFAASFMLTFFVAVIGIVTPAPAQASEYAIPCKVSFQGLCIMLSRKLKLQAQSILRRIGQKCTFGVNVGWVAQIAA